MRQGLHRVVRPMRGHVPSSSSLLLLPFPSHQQLRQQRFQPQQYQQQRAFSVEFASIVSSVQSSLISVHTVTHLDWWATIGLSTIAMRLALIPLVRQQILLSHKIGKATAEINFLSQLLKQRLSSATKPEESVQVVQVFIKGLRSCLVLHDIRVWEFFLYPAINFGIFVTFVYSVRDLVLHGPLDLHLEEGGLLWFRDLSEKDLSFVLPFLALSVSYINLDIALTSPRSSKFVTVMKDVFQSLILLSVPFVSSLPCGVFCYWIPNSFFGLAQTVAFRDEKVLAFLGLPPPPNASSSFAPPSPPNKTE